jgi:hypothetical protein
MITDWLPGCSKHYERDGDAGTFKEANMSEIKLAPEQIAASSDASPFLSGGWLQYQILSY